MSPTRSYTVMDRRSEEVAGKVGRTLQGSGGGGETNE